MSDDIAVVERTLEDYRSEVKPTWCPGCGDFGVLNAVLNVMKEKNIDPKDIAVVSGIGCSSRMPFFIASYGFHGIHGRTLPIATGLRTARPDLPVVVAGGDGDAFAIGGGHFIHGARRNLDITYVVMDNSIYGLTKGQTSPTSRTGFATKTTPFGSVERSINPLLMAIGSGATFVARGFSGQPRDLTQLIRRGMDHKGFSFIDVYSPCATFNKMNTFKYYREMATSLPENHDPSNVDEAIRMAMLDEPLYVGVFYETRAPSFEDALTAQRSGAEVDAEQHLEKLFDRFS
jgi:2-oxoglutarate/2-oxoacid ferredoxin oxidoreductase subunit beta